MRSLREREAIRNVILLRRLLESPERDASTALQEARRAELERLLWAYPAARTVSCAAGEAITKQTLSEAERAASLALGIKNPRPHPVECAMAESPMARCDCWCRGALHGLGLLRRFSLLDHEPGNSPVRGRE